MHYVHREAQLEKKVENALEKGFCALMGFPGIGKTTTARYVSAKLSKEKTVIWIVPTTSGESGVRVYPVEEIFETDEGKLEGLVIEARVNYTLLDEWRFYEFLFSIADVAEKPEKYVKKAEKHLKKFWNEFVEWLKKKKPELAKKVLKHVRETHHFLLPVTHVAEFAKALKEFLEEKGFDEFIKGLGVEEIGSAIAEVVPMERWSLMEKLKGNVRRMFAGGELVNSLANTLGKFVENISGATGVSIEDLVGKYSQYLFISVFGFLGFTGFIELARAIKEEKEEEKREKAHKIVREKLEKLKERVVFVVDDLEDAKREYELNRAVLYTMKIIWQARCPLMVVKRFSKEKGMKFGEMWELLNKREEDRLDYVMRILLGINYIDWGMDLKYIEENNLVITLYDTSFEEFYEILKANGIELSEEEARKWHGMFSCTPHLAISLLKFNLKPEDIEIYWESGKRKQVGYYVHEVKSTEDAENVYLWYVSGISSLYEAVMREAPYLVPLSFHPVAEDEMRELFDRLHEEGGIRWSGREVIAMLEDEGISRGVRETKEEWEDGERSVYRLEGDVEKLRIYFEDISEHAMPKNEELFKKAKKIAKIRLTMLRILTEQHESTGKFSFRTLYASILDAEFLLWFFNEKMKAEEIGASDDEVKDIYLLLLGIGCRYSKFLFFKFRGLWGTGIALERLKNGSIYALWYFREIARHLRSPTDDHRELLKDIYNGVSNFKADCDHELAWKLSVQAKILLTLMTHLAEDKVSLLKEFNGLIEEAEKIKSETLKKRVLIVLLLGKVEGFLMFTLSKDELKKVWRICDNIKKLIDEIDKVKDLDEESIKFFELYGGKPEETFKKDLFELKSWVSYRLGRIQLDFGNEGAMESFQKVFENYKNKIDIGNYHNAITVLSSKHRAEICLRWNFGEGIDLTDLKELFEKYKLICTPELESEIYAELAVSEALKGRNVENLVENVQSPVKAPLIGVLAILEKWDRNDAISELKRWDKWLAEGRKRDLEYLIESAVDPDWEEEFKWFAEYHNISLKEAREILELYMDEKPELKDKLLLLRPVSGIHSLIRILRLYLEGDLNKAIETADWRSKSTPPLPSKLFSQVAEALRKNDDRKFKEAMIKLFFYSV